MSSLDDLTLVAEPTIVRSSQQKRVLSTPDLKMAIMLEPLSILKEKLEFVAGIQHLLEKKSITQL